MRYTELSHFSHPQHKLKFDYSDLPFECDGCKEVGIGSRYRCATCDFDLHHHCALPSPSIAHPFYTKCTFHFLSRPPGHEPRYCNACEKDVTGFLYHCYSCGFDLHPCCAKLPAVLDDGEIKLFLYRKVGASCQKCGRKGRSWSYRSSCKKYNLHVACVKEILVESWRDLYLARRGNRGSDDPAPPPLNVISSNKGRGFERKVPSLKNMFYQRKNKGKVMKKGCEVAAVAVQVVISALLGDPTALIAGVIGSLITAG